MGGKTHTHTHTIKNPRNCPICTKMQFPKYWILYFWLVIQNTVHSKALYKKCFGWRNLSSTHGPSTQQEAHTWHLVLHWFFCKSLKGFECEKKEVVFFFEKNIQNYGGCCLIAKMTISKTLGSFFLGYFSTIWPFQVPFKHREFGISSYLG